MKYTFFAATFPLFLFSVFFTTLPLAAQSASELERLKNPIFTPALDWLKDPVPCPDSQASSEPEMKAYQEKIPETDITFRMVPIPGGKFLLGSPETEKGRQADEGPVHEVTIAPFWMEEHETTWKEFEQYALKHLRQTHLKSETRELQRNALVDAFAAPTAPYNISSISYGKSGKDGYPASGMTYYAAQAYCKWLTALTGRYYRLPTEAEWEYACRAGSTTAYSFGDDPEQLDDYAWYFENVEEGYEKIKKKKPNKWGLYDMHGNVAEWVFGQYKADTVSQIKNEPENDRPKVRMFRIKRGLRFRNRIKFYLVADTYKKQLAGALQDLFVFPEGDFGQVVRGGHCDCDDPADLRSARRLFSNPEWKAQDPMFPQSIWWVTEAPFVGFRVVRPLVPPTAEEAKLYEPIPMVWKEYTDQNTRE